MMLEEKRLDIGLLELNYAEGPPSGPPLVLLHGGSARWQSFQSFLPDLIADWHVFAPDFRGHGKSGRVPKRYRLQDYTDDTIRFLEMGIGQPAILLGFSLGGEVSIMVAAQSPANVRAVVVGDAPLSMKKHEMFVEDRLAAWRDVAGGKYSVDEIIVKLKDMPAEIVGQATSVTMREKYGDDAPVFEWLATNLFHNDPDMLSALIDDFEEVVAGYDMETLLPRIRCPVLLLQADPHAGGLMKDADIERALTLLLKPTHIRLADVGHAMLPHKERVLAAMRRFLEQV